VVQLFNNWPVEDGEQKIGPYIGDFLLIGDSKEQRAIRLFRPHDSNIALNQIPDTQTRTIGLCSSGQTCSRLVEKLEIIQRTTEFDQYDLRQCFRKVVLSLGTNDIVQHCGTNRLISDYHAALVCLAGLGAREILIVIPPFAAIWWRTDFAKAHRRLRSYLKTFAKQRNNYWDVGAVRYSVKIRVTDCWYEFGRPVRGKKQSHAWVDWDKYTEWQLYRKHPWHVENRIPLRKHFERSFVKWRNGQRIHIVDRLHYNERGCKAWLRAVKFGLCSHFDREYRHWFYVFEAHTPLGSWLGDVQAEPDSDDEFAEELRNLQRQGLTITEAVGQCLKAGL
jgi:hypothetical protein